MPHSHFVWWRPPTKCLLATIKKFTRLIDQSNDIIRRFGCLAKHLLWYEKNWCVQYSWQAIELVVSHEWHLHETHRLHFVQYRHDRRAISTPHLCDCTQRGLRSSFFFLLKWIGLCFRNQICFNCQLMLYVRTHEITKKKRQEKIMSSVTPN